MIKTKICGECGRLLSAAASALRQHEADINFGLRLNWENHLTEEGRKSLAPAAINSFNAAQAAWAAYYRHVEKHGLLEDAVKGGSAA